jgi:hypothetical protein
MNGGGDIFELGNTLHPVIIYLRDEREYWGYSLLGGP